MPNAARVVSSDGSQRGSLGELPSDVRLNEVTVCHARDNLSCKGGSGGAFADSFATNTAFK